jgi:membrane protease YdiL (CAAX protease family)
LVVFLFINIFVAVFFEEATFRGFFFQWLRPGRSFFSAAALSGVFWSLYHLPHLLPFYEMHDDYLSVFAQMGGAFVDAFASAYVFERGGNVIWGWMLVHIVDDSTTLISISGYGNMPSQFPDLYVWAGSFLTVALTFPLVNRLLPKR